MESFINDVKPELREIVLALHENLLEFEPNFEHKKAWSGYSYKIGDNYSVLLVEYKDHIQAMIMRGIMLDDPKKNLEGRGVNTRHIKYHSLEDVSQKDLIPFLEQQRKLYDSGVTWK